MLIIDDALGDRIKTSVKNLDENWKVQMQGVTAIIDDHADVKPLSMLPTCMIFLKDIPYSNKVNKVEGIDVSKYTTHLQSMYEVYKR